MVIKAKSLSNKSYKDPGFKDVSTKHPNYKNIAIAATHGLIEKGEKFYPNQPMTREKLAYLLVKGTFDVSEEEHFAFKEPIFKDVTENNPYRFYIETLARYKYINGYSDGTFKPKDSVTRAQFSRMLAKFVDHYTFMQNTRIYDKADAVVLRNVPNTMSFEYVDESTARIDTYYLNKASLNSKLGDLEYSRQYDTSDDGGSVTMGHSYNGMWFYVTVPNVGELNREYSLYLSMGYPLNERHYETNTIVKSMVEDFYPTENLKLNNHGFATVHNTILSVSEKLTIGNKTFEDVVVLGVDIPNGKTIAKIYFARNDGILKVETDFFKYTRVFE